jgi:hypothetical protein
MVPPELQREARKAWFEYGEAIKVAFRFPRDAHIISEALEAMLAQADENRVRRFVSYVRQQTKEVREMKWIGEPD